MAEKKYTDDEKRSLRVLKMQEGDLSRLQEKTESHSQQLSQLDERLLKLKQRAAAIAQEEGVELPKEQHLPSTKHEKNEKLNITDIPSWESLEERADKENIPRDIHMEDLLTGQEITYALSEVKRINDEFASRTGLTRSDLAFLSVATAIQTARWAMIPKIAGQLGKSGRVLAALSPSAMSMLEQKPDTKDLALVDETNQEFIEEAEEIHEGPKSWDEILEQRDDMPDNAFNNDSMNWLFGIVNKITGTHTSSNFSSTDAVTGESVSTPGVLAEALRSIKEDPRRLTAAVYTQYAQQKAAQGETVDLLSPVTDALQPGMGSDIFQAQSQQLASMSDLTLIGKQAAFPLVVNMAVGLLHGMMYDPEKDGPREFYDARTRKILLLSNLFASGSNLAFTMSTEQWAKLDIGGLLVSGVRTIQDVAYLTNLEDHFLKQELDKVYEKELQDIESHFKHEIIKRQ
jgi:hypothetical protein